MYDTGYPRLILEFDKVFNFVPGLGACGFTNTSSQNVASVSSTFFNSYPYVPFERSSDILLTGYFPSSGATTNPNE